MNVLLPNLLIELTWTLSFLVSALVGAYQVGDFTRAEKARKAKGVNGPIQLQTRLLRGRAVIRVLIATAALALGVGALISPDVEIIRTGYTVLTIGTLLILAVGYAVVGVYEVAVASRQLRVLRAEAARKVTSTPQSTPQGETMDKYVREDPPAPDPEPKPDDEGGDSK